MYNLFGSDILLDEELKPLIANNGELIMSSDIETVLQDIKMRLTTLKGSLFYDKSFGSDLPNYIKDDEVDNATIEAEVVRSIEMDPRIEPYATIVNIKNEKNILSVYIEFKFIDIDTPYNLTIPNVYEVMNW